MYNCRKALSVFLCAALMFTTLCFFPLVSPVTEANAAEIDTDGETAFYVPEVIYLYPDVTSWTQSVSTPFQYYVGNTVDTENIYASPVADANLDNEGKIYFAVEEETDNVTLSAKFLNAQGEYLGSEAGGSVEFTTEDKGEYYLFTVNNGSSPVLAASENGAFIEWCVTYVNGQGETKAVFSYSYIYKPYVVPYGAAVRVENIYGSQNITVFDQQITWVSGVHAIDNTAAATNTLYPYYNTVEHSTATYAFSPFLSKDNKAFVGGTEVSGAAPVANGGYNAVFAGSDPSTAYFYAGQSGAEFSSSVRVRNFFYTAASSSTYPYGSFDYMNNSSVSTQYAVSQVTPTRLGSISIDTSRYDNLSEIPNLAVGMMITDTDVFKDGKASSGAAQWYIGDATDKTHKATGTYSTQDDYIASFTAVNKKFVYKESLTTPLTLGISYAGAWDREIDKSVSTKKYVVKSYLETVDEENDRQVASAAVSLVANQTDKSVLRAAVDNATSCFSALGVKENWNSYYYDITYIDPDTGASAWNRFENAYKNASRILTAVDGAGDADAAASELDAALNALLAGKGLRVYFDVNYDNIGINLWINPQTSYYEWNAENETVVIDGNISASVYYGKTPFTPDAGEYTISAEVLAGTFNQKGCVVFDAVKEDGNNATNAAGGRYNFDFKTTKTQVFSYESENYTDIDAISFWTWYNEDAGDGVYDNFTARLKIEKGNTKTAYSPVGKVVGTTYGTLPVPSREGYLFSGWYKDAALTTKVDASSEVSARILYAKWEKAQYNVVFDGNGATSGSMAEQTLVYDEISALNANAFAKTGYVFNGWKDAEGNSYADAAEVINLTSEHQGRFTLYAQWTPNQYTVAFDGNTGLGGLGVLGCVYDMDFVLPENYFIKTGYTFIGWSDSANGAVIYTDKQNVKNLTPDVDGAVTLYAVWQPNTFNVSFDANTGTGSMADVSVVYDSKVALPACGFTKTGYSFVGWALSADSNVPVTAAEYDKLRTEEGDSVTLYAIWSENSFTLKFDKNGGTGENIPATVYGYEATIELPRNVFSKTGYVLKGWSTEKNGALVYTNGESVKNMVSENNAVLTLYAVWAPAEYTVVFDANTGTGSMGSISMVYDTAKALPANTFTKEGYHFIGWTTVKGGSVQYADMADAKNLTAENGKTVTLYAVWEINTYTVTFKYFNGEGAAVSTPVSVTHGATVKVPDDFTVNAYKDANQHYVFKEWSASLENITSDMTIEARYPAALIENHNMKTSVKDSTCATPGYTLYYCSGCSYSYEVEIGLKNHTWDDGRVATEPGCCTPGVFVYTCRVCGGTTSDAIDPINHSLVDFAAKTSTCSEEGNIAHKHCENCEKCFATDATPTTPDSEALTDAQVKLPKLPHTEGAEATCTTAQTCTVCGEEITAAFGHTEKTEYITSTATCQTAGEYVKKVTCEVCKEVISEETATGTVPHTYSERITPPDCVNAGYTTFTCTVCGDSYTGNAVAAKGHTPGNTWIVTTAPGCTVIGIETAYCTICGEACATRDVEATGHDEGTWEISVAAQCEKTGIEILKCTKCSTTIDRRTIAAKGHGETKTEVTLAPGCTTAGKSSNLCVDCGKELSFTIIPETGHSPDGAADCEKDSICSSCGEVLAAKTGHSYDNGVVTKEPTETEEGVKTYTCQNNSAHTYTESIPVRIVIVLPEIPEDGTYDLDAAENGYAGNVNNLITTENSVAFTVISSDTSIVQIDTSGNIFVKADGQVVLTVRTTDGKYSKNFVVTARTLRTVKLDINSVITSYKAYVGDKITAPEVESFVDENGFTRVFRSWTINGADVTELVVTGDVTFVAVYTEPCDYTELDRLTAVFNELLSGKYDNAASINLYKAEIAAVQAEIDTFAKDRNVRDSSAQAMIKKTCDALNSVISKIYTEDGASVEIRCNAEYEVGTVIELGVYLMPLDIKAENVVWTTSDPTIGFFANGTFYAVKAGTVTVTATVGDLTDIAEITVKSGTHARVIMFDALLSNANYIVEGTYIVNTTTNLFWAPDAPISFRVVTDGTFEEYYVYINGVVVTPDASGTYVIPANSGDAHVKIEGVVKKDNGEKVSFFDMIRDFFKKIADFFRNLFTF